MNKNKNKKIMKEFKKALSEKEFDRLRITVELLISDPKDVTFIGQSRDEVRRQTLYEITENIKLVKKFSLEQARRYIKLRERLSGEGE